MKRSCSRAHNSGVFLGVALALFSLSGRAFADLLTPSSSTLKTVAWYDASDLSTIHTNDAAGRVSQWDDKSTSNFHLTQTTQGSQPATGTQTIGGLNAIDFDGTNHFMSMVTGSFDVKGGMICVVLIPDTFNRHLPWFGKIGESVSFGSDNANAGTTAGLWYNANSPYWNHIVNDVYSPGLTMQMTEPVLAAFIGDSNLCFTVNGTFVSSGTGNAGSGTTVIDTVAKDAGAYKFYGKIGEIVLSETISTDVRQKLEGYLAHKWGLDAKLPADHPFKDNPPTTSGTVVTLN